MVADFLIHSPYGNRVVTALI